MSAQGKQTEGITWVAAEFVEHSKTPGWYVVLGLAAGIIAIAVYFLAGQDWFSAISVLVVILALGVFAGRRPDKTQYQLTHEGITIGDKFYPYSNFASFAIVHDGNFESIYLTPVQRFAVPLNIYFPDQMGEQILELISRYVVYIEKDLPTIERLMHRLRF